MLTPRRGYIHHGIYVGQGLVVQYAGLSREVRRGPVEEVPVSQFALVSHISVAKVSTNLVPTFRGRQELLKRFGDE